MILRARTPNAAFYSDHLGQSPLVLNHIELATKIKWDQSREIGFRDIAMDLREERLWKVCGLPTIHPLTRRVLLLNICPQPR